MNISHPEIRKQQVQSLAEEICLELRIHPRAEVGLHRPLGVGDNLEVSQNYGYLFRGPHNKDYSTLGSILGSPYWGNLPFSVDIPFGPE